MPTTATFRDWRRQRPFGGSLLLLLAGVEMFFSTQLDIGNMHIQLGVGRLSGHDHPARLRAARGAHRRDAAAPHLLR
jgi:hypothetical protein